MSEFWTRITLKSQKRHVISFCIYIQHKRLARHILHYKTFTSISKLPHNFWEFFTLIDLPKKTANKRAVCKFCIKEYTLSVASLRTDCFVSNKTKLCCRHLTKCVNFECQVSEKERKKILARKVPEDDKKVIKKQKIDKKGKNICIIEDESG